MDEDSNAESLKVVLLGESGVGKTSIISQLMEQEFNDEQTSTTGATFSTKTMVFDNKGICFEIWDTAGQEKYRALTKMFYKDAGAAILVYDITRQASFEELKNYWANQVRENAPKKIVLAVAANKSDLIDTEQVDEKTGRAFAKEIGAIFKSTSAKNQKGIEELFKDIGNKYLDPNFECSDEALEEEQRLKAIRKQSMKIKKDPQPNPVNQEANTNNEGSNTVGQTGNNVSVHEKKKGCC